MDISKHITALLEGLQPAFRSRVKDSLSAFDRQFEQIARNSTLEDAVYCLTGSTELLKPLSGSKVTQSQLINNPHLEYHLNKYCNKTFKISLIAQCSAQTRTFFGRNMGPRRSSIIALKILAKLVDREKNPQTCELYQHALQLIGNQARLTAELHIAEHDANLKSLPVSDEVYQFSLDILRAALDHIERFPYSSTAAATSPTSQTTSLDLSFTTTSIPGQGPAGSILDLDSGSTGTQTRAASKTMSPEQQQLTSQITKTDKQVRLPPHLTKSSTLPPTSPNQTPPFQSQSSLQTQPSPILNSQSTLSADQSTVSLSPQLNPTKPLPALNNSKEEDDDQFDTDAPGDISSPSFVLVDSTTPYTGYSSTKSQPTRPNPGRLSTAPQRNPTVALSMGSVDSNAGSSSPRNIPSKVDQSNKSVFSKLKDKFSTKAHYQAIRKQSTIIHDGILFGRSLEDLVHDEMCDDSQVPYFLIIIGQYLLSDDSLCEQEGIFRVPGNVAKVTQLKQSLDYNHVFRPQDCDVHDLCNIIKLWLRELPEPLIPHALLPPLVQSFQAGDELLVFGLLNSAQIPVPNRATLHYLLRIGAHITAPRFKKFNQMSTQSIAVVFAPNIFRQRPGTTSANLPQTQQDMSSAVAILMLLMESVRSELPTDILGTVRTPNANHNTPGQTQITVTDTGMVVGDLSLDDIPDIDTTYFQRGQGDLDSPLQQPQYIQVRPSPALAPNEDDLNYISMNNLSIGSQSGSGLSILPNGPQPLNRRGSVLASDQFEYKGPAIEQYQRRPTLSSPPDDDVPLYRISTQHINNSSRTSISSQSPLIDPKADFEFLKQQLEQQGEVDVENIRAKQDKSIIYKEDDHYVDVSRGLELYSSNGANSSPAIKSSAGRQRAANPEMATPSADQTNRPIPVNMRSALDTIPEWQKKKLQNLPLPTVPPTSSNSSGGASPLPLDQRPLPPRPDQVENARILTQEHRRSSVVERDSSIPRSSNQGLEYSTAREQSVQPYYALPRGHRGSITGANPAHINPRRSISQAPPGFRSDESLAALLRSPQPSLSITSTPPTSSSIVPTAGNPSSLSNHYSNNASLFGANAQGMAIGRKVGKKNYYVPGRGNVGAQGPSFFNAGLNVQPSQYSLQPVSLTLPSLQLPPTPRNTALTFGAAGSPTSNPQLPVASRLRQTQTKHTKQQHLPTISPSFQPQSVQLADDPSFSDSENDGAPPPPPGAPADSSSNQMQSGDFDPTEAGDQALQLPPSIAPPPSTFKPVRIRNSISYDSSNRIISDNVQSENSLGGPSLKISTSFSNKMDSDLTTIGEDSATPSLSRHMSHSPRINNNGAAFAFENDRSAEIISQSTGISVEIVRERGQSFVPPRDPEELSLGWEEYQEVNGSSYYHHISTNTISYFRPCWKNREKVKLNPDPIQTPT